METTYLAKALARFYTEDEKKGIIFRNGLSAYKLGELMGVELTTLHMEELFRYQNLWRVIRGKRLFSVDQLKVFSHRLSLTPKEQRQLEAALGKDRLDRLGLVIDFGLSCNDLLDRFADAPDRIHATWLLGVPENALDWASDVEGLLRDCLANYPVAENADAIRRLLGRVLYEKMRTYQSVLLPQDILNISRYHLPEVKRLGERTGDHELVGLAHLAWSIGHYLAGNNTRSYRHTLIALARLHRTDYQIIAWRNATLVTASLGCTQVFKESAKKLRQLSQEYLVPELRALALEGLLKAQVEHKPSQALKTMAELKEVHAQMEKSGQMVPIRIVQYVRTDLRLKQAFDDGDIGLSPTEDQLGFFLAKALRYKRYVDEIGSINRSN